MKFSPLLWQNRLLSVNKGVHMWECGTITINYCKEEQTVPWVLYKLYPPTLSLEKWHHIRLCPQQTPRAHKNWKWRLIVFFFISWNYYRQFYLLWGAVYRLFHLGCSTCAGITIQFFHSVKKKIAKIHSLISILNTKQNTKLNMHLSA